MNLRTVMNEHPAVAVAAALALIAISAAGALYAMKPARYGPPTKAFYTTDDGKTLFVDDVDKQTPFQHGGKEAVKAYVYTCDGGKTQFVAYLERMPDGAPPAGEAAQTPAPAAAPKDEASFRASREAAIRTGAAKAAIPAKPGQFMAWVRKPGDANWLKPGSPRYFPTIAVRCPADSPNRMNRVNP